MAPQLVPDPAAGLPWPPARAALFQALAPSIADALERRRRETGIALGDVLVWVDEDAPDRWRHAHRAEAQQALARGPGRHLPDGREVVERLGQPAPAGCFWLLLAGAELGVRLAPASLHSPGAKEPGAPVPHPEAHLEWTPAHGALVNALAPQIEEVVRGLVQETGIAIGDVLVWIHENDGERWRVAHRDEAARALRDLPQAGEWVERLSRPAGVCSFWLFISGDGPGAFLTQATFTHGRPRAAA